MPDRWSSSSIQFSSFGDIVYDVWMSWFNKLKLNIFYDYILLWERYIYEGLIKHKSRGKDNQPLFFLLLLIFNREKFHWWLQFTNEPPIDFHCFFFWKYSRTVPNYFLEKCSWTRLVFCPDWIALKINFFFFHIGDKATVKKELNDRKMRSKAVIINNYW